MKDIALKVFKSFYLGDIHLFLHCLLLLAEMKLMWNWYFCQYWDGLKNVMGLWLLQECQRSFARKGQVIEYDILLTSVESVLVFTALIDPNAPRFLAPQDMPEAINASLQERE